MSLQNLSVSVVIPNYNGKKLLESNLPQVLASAPNAEIVIVDDHSTDDSVSWITQNHPEIKLVIHGKNLRFAAACNSGVHAAQGDVVVLLNNDVIPEKDFLFPLVKHFKDSQVFAVGCGEKVNKNSKDISGRGCGTFERGLMVHWKCKDQTSGLTLWVSGGSGAFRKSIWEEIGDMDTMFKPAYEEDRDICYRALKRGFKVVFEPTSIVYHKHETTNKEELGEWQMKTASYKNHFLIVWKNVTNGSMMRRHLWWLPYHLTIGVIKSRGAMLVGFIKAVLHIPQMISKRSVEKKYGKVSDEKILNDNVA